MVSHRAPSSGFSQKEIVIAVAVLVVLAGAANFAFNKLKPVVQSSKIESDVKTLNNAIRNHRQSGGDLTGISDAGLILAKLKSERPPSEADTFVGFTGSMIGKEVTLVPVTAREKGARLIYDSTTQRFTSTSKSVAGYRMTLGLPGETTDTINEEGLPDTALQFASYSNGGWNYEDAPKTDPLNPTRVSVPASFSGPIVQPELVSLAPDQNPTAPTTPTELSPPVFSKVSGNLTPEDYPFPLTLTNPNGGLGQIQYAFTALPNWSWIDYSGPIAISPGDQVSALIKSATPSIRSDSALITHKYLVDKSQLSPPTFSLPSGLYPPGEYPLSLTLNHTNGNKGEIVYTNLRDSAPSPQVYTDELAIRPGDEIRAYVRAVDPELYLDSPSEAAHYKTDPVKLTPPVFSIKTGAFQAADYPFVLTLTHTNPSGGRILYANLTADTGIQEFTSPVIVNQNDQIEAYVESPDSELFYDSEKVAETYSVGTSTAEPTIALAPPTILGPTTMRANGGSAYSQFRHTNTEPDLEIQYRVSPLVPGKGTELGWTSYPDGAYVHMYGTDYPRGFVVTARVISLTDSSLLSSEVDQTVTTYHQLDQPTIRSDVAIDISNTTSADITITHSNPPEALVETLYNIVGNDGTSTEWITYSGTFSIDVRAYPNGFRIQSYVRGLNDTENYYRESAYGYLHADPDFFGTRVTGKTIFIIDRSGSMSTYGRTDRLKSATLQALKSFSETDQFGIIEYHNEATVLTPFDYATQTHKADAEAAVSSLEVTGGTNYLLALEAATAAATDADQIIFLSDGYPSTSEGVIDLVNQLAASGITQLDTIMLGSSTNTILQDMAKAGGGTFRQILD